jgi:hypothetical protein
MNENKFLESYLSDRKAMTMSYSHFEYEILPDGGPPYTEKMYISLSRRPARHRNSCQFVQIACMWPYLQHSFSQGIG